MNTKILNILFISLFGVNAASLRGKENSQPPARQLRSYVNPLQWLQESAPGEGGNPLFSCAIRRANVPNGQGFLLTAEGNEVSNQPRRDDGSDNILYRQRWVLSNRRIFHGGPAFNLINPDNGELSYLSTDQYGNTDMYTHDDGSGRQLWRINKNSDNGEIKWDHQFEIQVAGGTRDPYYDPNVTPGPTLLSMRRSDDRHSVELGHRVYNDLLTWELIDCYEV